jgi:hypothetical protein
VRIFAPVESKVTMPRRAVEVCAEAMYIEVCATRTLSPAAAAAVNCAPNAGPHA